MCRIGTYKEVVIFLHAWSNPWANLQMTFSQRVELPLKCIFSFFLQRQKTTRENQKNPNTPPLRLSFKDKSVFFFLEPGGSAARLKPNQTGRQNLQGLFWFVFLAKCVCIRGGFWDDLHRWDVNIFTYRAETPGQWMLHVTVSHGQRTQHYRVWNRQRETLGPSGCCANCSSSWTVNTSQGEMSKCVQVSWQDPCIKRKPS